MEHLKHFGSNRRHLLLTSLQVYEGQRTLAAENNPLGHFTLRGLPKARASEATATLKFELSADGNLRVSAIANGTGTEAEMTVNYESLKIKSGQVGEVLEQARLHEAQDRKAVERGRALGNLELELEKKEYGISADVSGWVF